MLKMKWIINIAVALSSTLLVLPSANAQLHHHCHRAIQENSEQNPFAHAYSLQQIVADMTSRATAGVLVRSLSSGKTLYSKAADQLFAPASNMKVITAFAGLKYLGPGFVYHTRLMTDAPSINPANGVLQGNLYLKYDGDPSLEISDLDDLFGNLANQGISSIQGNLYVDTSRYDKQGISPGTEAHDLGYCYGAPITSSTLNHNCVTVKLYGDTIGAPAKLSFPYGVALPITNSVVTGSGGLCHVSVQRTAEGHYVLTGRISRKQAGVAVTMPVPCDAAYGEAAAAQLLARHNIRVLGNNIATKPTSQLQAIAVHESKPLAELVVQMMKRSDNLIANAVFKSVGAAYNKQSASWENSSAAVRAILRNNGVDTTGMVIVDGSGLSRNNQVTPSQLVQVLSAAYKDPAISALYQEALPVGGLNGTLKHRLTGRDIIGKVKAKTGSMHGVSSLSGYVEAHDGEILVFSIIMNDFSGGLYRYRTLEDNLCRVLRANY